MNAYALSYTYRPFYNPLLGLLQPPKIGGFLRYVQCGSTGLLHFPGEQHREFTFWLGAEGLEEED